ncbi:protein kinase [Armatimonas sp.]|uniref:protein kinase domain-containing protein n=1 Tax=Armatimonas sp. TaxID=1872638 RepID=UPI0037505044
MAQSTILSMFESPSTVDSPTPGGTVWLARDPVMQRPVLLKRLPTSANRSRLTEALTLDHPAIARTRRWLLDENELYVVRDVARGKNLRQRLSAQGGRPDTETLRKFLLPVLEALEYAHGRQLPHGGLSYENILIADDGAVMLTDFGATDPAASHHRALYNGSLTVENDIQAMAKLIAALLPTTGPFATPTVRSRVEGVTLRCETLGSLREVLASLEKLATAPLPRPTSTAVATVSSQTPGQPGIPPPLFGNLPTSIAPALTEQNAPAPTKGVAKLVCSQPDRPLVPQGGGGLLAIEAKNDGDATLLIRMVATQHAWLNVRPTNLPLVLPPGASVKIGFVVSAARLAGGEYRSAVYLSSNAPGPNAEDLRTGWWKHSFEVRIMVGGGGGSWKGY